MQGLRADLLAWWEIHGRHDIPWKRHPDGARPGPGEPLDPFGVWVAEVMLQQTQLAVVLPYWHRWMAAFPDVGALAAASEHDVLMLWQGLGYYARARRLHGGAQRLVAAGGDHGRPFGDVLGAHRIKTVIPSLTLSVG